MRARGLSVVSATLMGLSTCIAANVAPLPVVQAARWQQKRLSIRLYNLPKRYSCSELERKFEAVLLELGARSDAKIQAHRCERRLGAIAFSPSVNLQFWAPQATAAVDERSANIRAVRKSIHLQPGTPSSLDSSDCQLLRQIKDTLIPSLPSDRTGNFRLACQAPAPEHYPAFRITVDALLLVPAQVRVAGGPNDG
jgi:hypothetical protein